MPVNSWNQYQSHLCRKRCQLVLDVWCVHVYCNFRPKWIKIDLKFTTTQLVVLRQHSLLWAELKGKISQCLQLFKSQPNLWLSFLSRFWYFYFSQDIHVSIMKIYLSVSSGLNVHPTKFLFHIVKLFFSVFLFFFFFFGWKHWYNRQGKISQNLIRKFSPSLRNRLLTHETCAVDKIKRDFFLRNYHQFSIKSCVVAIY